MSHDISRLLRYPSEYPRPDGCTPCAARRRQGRTLLPHLGNSIAMDCHTILTAVAPDSSVVASPAL